MHDTGAHGPEDYLQNLYKKYKAKKHHRRQRRHHPHGPIQQDQDSKFDLFQTQNIGIKDIEARGNVLIGAPHFQHPHPHPHPHGLILLNLAAKEEGKIKKEKRAMITMILMTKMRIWGRSHFMYNNKTSCNRA
jgi:hypothetical protein